MTGLHLRRCPWSRGRRKEGATREGCSRQRKGSAPRAEEAAEKPSRWDVKLAGAPHRGLPGPQAFFFFLTQIEMGSHGRVRRDSALFKALTT